MGQSGSPIEPWPEETRQIMVSVLQAKPDQLRKHRNRALAWTLWVLPIIQCLAASLASPKPPSLLAMISGFLYWISAILPLWWFSHFISKIVLKQTSNTGWMLWVGLALGSVLAFLTADLLGYFFFLNQVFEQWLGASPSPFAVPPPDFSNLLSIPVLLGALGHMVIWLSANLSARFLIGNTIYDPMRITIPNARPGAPAPAFLDRVAEERRQGLFAIQAQEHYISVHTASGSELILYRFGDALKELSAVPGLQVHRSFWVANGSVIGHERKNGQLFLKLRNGLEVPVSRSFVRDVEQSGLVQTTSQPGTASTL